MKKGLIIIGVIILAVLILYGFFAGRYNTMVELQENIPKEWAQVESQYQRRADLIPNLVNTVKGYANFEQETLTKVIEARASATQVKVDPSNITPEQLQKFQQAQNGVGSALSRLLVVAENYPELKANQNFLDLQAQLEGTENRIAVARNRFNEVVQPYNVYIKRFPNNMLAGMYGFTSKGYFEAAAGSENAPTVDFGK
ncbi:LemA family protein [Ohtaekwangia koreensis]|uniref:LemA protein n=1 Tax=Ohtaekwangia koreensis TaxID=688867 RepID=A0A1T5LFJ1_9BACT|nr:LemA family protein [Ohtaekwangia koreensis]SKC74465.1 LemA protein [Ohtaekwangia koreensis]